jgi:CBS domain-containing protein
VTNRLLFASRLMRLPLLSADGAVLGKLDDLIVVASFEGQPRVIGFVASVQRRRIFVNAARVGELSSMGARLRTGNIDVRHFEQREGEIRVRELFDTQVGNEYIVDLALEPAEHQPSTWLVSAVALGGRGPLRSRRNPRVVSWRDVRHLFDTGPVAAEMAELRELHPSDVAARMRNLPRFRRQQWVQAMGTEALAEMMGELPEDEQVDLIELLDIEHAAEVIEQMEPDDAADLLAELPEVERQQVLEAMDDEDSTPLRRLRSYGKASAGGLMTSDPVVFPGTASVADALAAVRDSDLEVALATQVFVVLPPTSTPTGRFLGVVGFQRLLREPPWTRLEDLCDDDPEYLTPDVPDDEVAIRLATYDLVAIAVCDDAQRLIGAVTVDDVIDHMLPPTWRRQRRGTRA